MWFHRVDVHLSGCCVLGACGGKGSNITFHFLYVSGETSLRKFKQYHKTIIHKLQWWWWWFLYCCFFVPRSSFFLIDCNHTRCPIVTQACGGKGPNIIFHLYTFPEKCLLGSLNNITRQLTTGCSGGGGFILFVFVPCLSFLLTA